MKVSKYNKFFNCNEGGTILAYNCLAGSLATLTQEKYQLVKEILGSLSFDTDEKQNLWNDLLEGGFLIEDDVNELDILKIRNRTSRFDKSRFTLTILPTLNCNFQCSYCYEAKKNVTMNKEIQQTLIEYVEKKTKEAENFTPSWYGGEPLMVFDIVRNLHKEFDKICKANNCHYNSGGIITNGYLLTKDIALELKEMGIGMVQVTLDGPKDIHDQRRKLVNGAGTFDKIMQNLSIAADILKGIAIRVNIDSTNVDQAIGVLDAIEKYDLKGKVSIYFAQVRAFTETCADISSSCLMDQEYASLEVKLMKQSLDQGFSITRYPRPRFSYCVADHINSFVVDPTGYLYKCWSNPGVIDEAIGHISNLDENKAKAKNLFKWLGWDVFERKECRQCEVLPICMGGCPYLGLKLKEKKQGKCETSRYNFLDMLKLYYTSVSQKQVIKVG